MEIKVFDEIFEAEDYIYLHPYEIVYLTSLNRFMFSFMVGIMLFDVYRVCSSVPFSSDFYSEANALYNDLMLYKEEINNA